MKQPVMIKGNKFGITLVLDEQQSFEDLIPLIGDKFKESSKFFDSSSQMALAFEGKKLDSNQQSQVLDIIVQNCDLNITYIMDQDSEVENKFKQTIEEKLKQTDVSIGKFYKGNLRSGQSIEVDSSIIMIGDVNPGAKVIAKGNIIVLGCLKGTAYAGASGNQNAFVVALNMAPMQIRIADVIARSPDKPSKDISKEAQIAFLEGENIYIEPINKSVLNDIHLF